MIESELETKVLDEIIDSVDSVHAIECFYIELPIYKKEKKCFFRFRSHSGYEDTVEELRKYSDVLLQQKTSYKDIVDKLNKRLYDLGESTSFEVYYIDLEKLIRCHGEQVCNLFK